MPLLVAANALQRGECVVCAWTQRCVVEDERVARSLATHAGGKQSQSAAAQRPRAGLAGAIHARCTTGPPHENESNAWRRHHLHAAPAPFRVGVAPVVVTGRWRRGQAARARHPGRSAALSIARSLQPSHPPGCRDATLSVIAIPIAWEWLRMALLLAPTNHGDCYHERRSEHSAPHPSTTTALPLTQCCSATRCAIVLCGA